MAILLATLGYACAAEIETGSWSSGTEVVRINGRHQKHVWSYYDNLDYSYHKSSVKMGPIEDISPWKRAGDTSYADIYQTKTINIFKKGFAYYDYKN
jgi:hypothetical protein